MDKSSPVNPFPCPELGLSASLYPIVSSVTAVDGWSFVSHGDVNKDAVNMVSTFSVRVVSIAPCTRDRSLSQRFL